MLKGTQRFTRATRLCLLSWAASGVELVSLRGWNHGFSRISRLAGIKSQLEDLAMFLRRYADTIEASPERLQQIETRLALLERLKRKYGPTLADAMARRDRLRREIDDLEGSEERLADLQRRYTRPGTPIWAPRMGWRLRVAVSRPISRGELETLLGELAMERTQVEMRFNAEPLAEPAWTASGIDEAELYVSPNQGEELRPFDPGGLGRELSRIMLAIKTLTATHRHGFTRSGRTIARG